MARDDPSNPRHPRASPGPPVPRRHHHGTSPVRQDDARPDGLPAAAVRLSRGPGRARVRDRGPPRLPRAVSAGRGPGRGPAGAPARLLSPGDNGRAGGEGRLDPHGLPGLRAAGLALPEPGGPDRDAAPAPAEPGGAAALPEAPQYPLGCLFEGRLPPHPSGGHRAPGFPGGLRRDLPGARRSADPGRGRPRRVPDVRAALRGAGWSPRESLGPGRRRGCLPAHRPRLALGAGGRLPRLPPTALPAPPSQAAHQDAEALLLRLGSALLPPRDPRARAASPAPDAGSRVRELGRLRGAEGALPPGCLPERLLLPGPQRPRGGSRRRARHADHGRRDQVREHAGQRLPRTARVLPRPARRERWVGGGYRSRPRGRAGLGAARRADRSVEPSRFLGTQSRVKRWSGPASWTSLRLGGDLGLATLEELAFPGLHVGCLRGLRLLLLPHEPLAARLEAHGDVLRERAVEGVDDLALGYARGNPALGIRLAEVDLGDLRRLRALLPGLAPHAHDGHGRRETESG